MISDAELSSEKKEDILVWEKKKIGFIFRSLLQEMPKMLFLWERGYPNAFL